MDREEIWQGRGWDEEQEEDGGWGALLLGWGLERPTWKATSLECRWGCFGPRGRGRAEAPLSALAPLEKWGNSFSTVTEVFPCKGGNPGFPRWFHGRGSRYVAWGQCPLWGLLEWPETLGRGGGQAITRSTCELQSVSVTKFRGNSYADRNSSSQLWYGPAAN